MILKKIFLRIEEYYLSFEKRFLIFLISFGIGGYLCFKNINSDNYLIILLSIIMLYIPFFDKIKFGNVELSKDIKEIKEQVSKISNKIEINHHYHPSEKSEEDINLNKISSKLKNK